MRIAKLSLWALITGCISVALGCGDSGGDPAASADNSGEGGSASGAGGQSLATGGNAGGVDGQQVATDASAGQAAGGSGGVRDGGIGDAKQAGGAGGSLDAGGSPDASNRNGEGDFTIAPPYSPAPEVKVGASVPRGTLKNFTLSSTASTIYPTDFATKAVFTRDVSVYIPKQYVAGTAVPFIVVQDGIAFYRDTMVPVLDNMINDRRLPVMIAIFVNPGPNEATPTGERSFEYDAVSDDYVRFVETELLPKIKSDYSLTLTTDPDGRAAMGGSSGGAAAFTMGWFRPDLYHRILTYSGSFCDLQPNASYPQAAWEYHDSLIASSPVKPLRVALAASQNDLNWNTSTDMHRNWLPANRAMAAVLASKGYHYRFVYAENAGHIDFAVLQQTLPETLAWLWQGYPIP